MVYTKQHLVSDNGYQFVIFVEKQVPCMHSLFYMYINLVIYYNFKSIYNISINLILVRKRDKISIVFIMIQVKQGIYKLTRKNNGTICSFQIKQILIQLFLYMFQFSWIISDILNELFIVDKCFDIFETLTYFFLNSDAIASIAATNKLIKNEKVMHT